MSSARSLLTGAALLVVLAPAATGQKAMEYQFQGVGAIADQDFYGGGLGIAWRSDGRMRVGGYANVGSFDRELAFRPEVTASFHLNPFKRGGLAPYVGGGVALVLTADESREFLVGTIGLEWSPGARRGWFLEAGIGGGARVSLGYQIRRRLSRRP